MEGGTHTWVSRIGGWAGERAAAGGAGERALIDAALSACARPRVAQRARGARPARIVARERQEGTESAAAKEAL